MQAPSSSSVCMRQRRRWRGARRWSRRPLRGRSAAVAVDVVLHCPRRPPPPRGPLPGRLAEAAGGVSRGRRRARAVPVWSAHSTARGDVGSGTSGRSARACAVFCHARSDPAPGSPSPPSVPPRRSLSRIAPAASAGASPNSTSSYLSPEPGGVGEGVPKAGAPRRGRGGARPLRALVPEDAGQVVWSGNIIAAVEGARRPRAARAAPARARGRAPGRSRVVQAACAQHARSRRRRCSRGVASSGAAAATSLAGASSCCTRRAPARGRPSIRVPPSIHPHRPVSAGKESRRLPARSGRLVERLEWCSNRTVAFW